MSRWLLVSSFNVSSKGLPFCFVVFFICKFLKSIRYFYSTLMGIFEKLLGLSSLKCFEALLVH